MSRRGNEFIPTRRSLLTRLKNWDDQEGWREFFDSYWKLIYSVALKSGFADAEAQDIVQDTVVSVAKKMRHFRYDPEVGSFKAWLLVVTRSRIADRLRKRRLPMAQVQPPAENSNETTFIERVPDPDEPGFDKLWETEWKQNLFDQAIESVKKQISSRQFQIFDLYVLQETPLATITGALGVSAGQVYLTKHRVSRLLKSELKKLEKKLENV